MMDNTPEKTQISSSLSKFEDSPVFNYINSLSPIKPLKSTHHTRTFNPLSFASLPSIFTSPHLSSNKETRFLKSYTDLSKPLLSSGEETKVSTNEEASLELPDEPSRYAIELPRTLKYDCGSPNCEPVPCVIETNCASKSTLSIVPFVQEGSENDFHNGGVEVHVAGISPTEEKRETIGSEWENLIPDEADILIFNSPNDSEAFRGLIQKSLDPEHINELPQTSLDSYELKDPSRQTEEANELNELIPAHETGTEMSDLFSSKLGSNLHCGFRRRLDFEMLAARRKNLNDDSNNQMVTVKPANDSSLCIIPGIGLHLNALTLTSRDNKNSKHKILSSGTQKLSFTRSTSSILPSSAGQEPVHESLTSASSERETDQLGEDASQASAYVVNEEFNQNSPKKKRRRLEQAGENESCKRCNCKKSKCLKLYCECFAAGVYCIEPCSCQDCFNKPIHEDTVLATRKQIESRNPLAFAPKVITASDSIPKVGDDDSSKTPASARHKRGCNCKKSSCLKKYCECYQGGVGCSINCRCEGCKNAFGKKDGKCALGFQEEDEETDPLDKNLEKTVIFNNEDQTLVSALQATPLQQLCRPLVQLPLSSTLYNGQRYGKPSIIRPRNVIEKHFQSVAEDAMPEMLLNDYSAGTGIKTSPNGKRISPPQGSTPGRRTGRKLILQSIPSFPSLTQH